ncbi:MAG: sensor histidine kinase [Sphingobacteriales bacterium]|nr:MAG: sensor histidine kinase [Sphingobacteriales bacterium]TAF81961.1 MAG: sensor histidine kinase [Sphingobacteriales bacterium]
MSFALLGVLAMQYYFIKESFSFKAQLFDRTVNEALKNVSLKLEKQEAAIFLSQKAIEKKLIQQNKIAQQYAQKKPKITPNAGLAFAKLMRYKQAKADSLFKAQDSLIRSNYPNALVFNDAAYVEAVNYNFRIDIEQIEDEYGFSHNIVQKVTKEKPQKNKFGRWKFPPVVDSVRQYLIFDPQAGPVLKVLPRSNFIASIKTKNLELQNNHRKQQNEAKNVKLFLDSVEKKKGKKNVLQDIANEYQQVNIPLKKRINPHLTDSLLKAELLNSGIYLAYNYKISSHFNDSVIYVKTARQKNNFKPDNTYKTPLFTNDVVRDAGYLTITFPQKNTVILNNMRMILASSTALLLILMGSFIYTIFSILRQKKLADMKTDFINNMTHEFKTPVATIMIASEALSDPEINNDTSRVGRLANIIYDENKRLGDHIERVLNIAKTEDENANIELKNIEVNDIIQAVADSMRLQLQKHNAVLTLQLNAIHHTITGDYLHLSNVIFNLIDNALKYSKDYPQININTQNNTNELIIKITDKGIGMNKDQLKKIFDQFYRIPTGNVHNVKGFGLGLSYVHTMVKKMNGSILVYSDKDIGSEFIIKFKHN